VTVDFVCVASTFFQPTFDHRKGNRLIHEQQQSNDQQGKQQMQRHNLMYCTKHVKQHHTYGSETFLICTQQ